MSVPRVPRNLGSPECAALASTPHGRLDNRYVLLLVLCFGSVGLHVWYNQMISRNATVVAARVRLGRKSASTTLSAEAANTTSSGEADDTVSDVVKQKVLSFSLYGSDPRYTVGAVENAKLFGQVYPGWSMHVFHDASVPLAVLSTLATQAVKLHSINKPVMNKRSWRFLAGAGFDNRTERFCSRDIDSRLSLREKRAVDAWVTSGKVYHVMRDHPSHSQFPMSAGMWCADARAFAFLAHQMVQVSLGEEFFEDTKWLNARVWPEAVKDVLQHDSFSCAKYNGSVPFPTRRVGWEHVGSVYLNGKMRESDVDVLRLATAPLECTPPEKAAVATDLDMPTANT